MSVNAITFDVSILNNIHKTYTRCGALSSVVFSSSSSSFFLALVTYSMDTFNIGLYYFVFVLQTFIEPA